MAGAIPFGCGQCLPCRITRRRQWMWRQYLESLDHDENCFITLTYAPEKMPSGANLVPADLRLWLKRFRERVAPTRIRYFAVGEYGEQNLRPHYHVSLFGMSGRTDVVSPSVVRHFGISKLVHETWGLGNILCAEFNEKTAQYTAGYVVKKMTAAGDPRLSGRHPEFARMSNRPGIGANSMSVIAKALGKHRIATGDVPGQLRLGKRTIPIGRYLLSRLRKEVGLTDDEIKSIKDRVSWDTSLNVQALFADAINSEEALTPRKAYLRSIEQKLRQVEVRSKLYSTKKGTL